MVTVKHDKIHAYIAYQYTKPESEDMFGYSTLLGWDTVTANERSKYQAMLGQKGVSVYMWEFHHHLNTLYRWDNKRVTWVELPKSAHEELIPEDLRMQELIGAL